MRSMTDVVVDTLGGFNPKTIFGGGAVLVLAILFLVLSGQLFEHLDAGQVMVIQAPFSGNLTWHTSPGVKWQGFGTVTKYPRGFQYWFSAATDEGKTNDQSIQVRFNDGGHGKISGSISIQMPVDELHLTPIHIRYHSPDGVQAELIRPVIEKAVYMTGPLMSSRESANEKRNYLIQFIEDQVQNGVYQTYTEDVKQPDPITGEQKTVSVVKLRTDPAGQFLRQDQSPLNTFGIRTYGLSVKGLIYDKQVEDQIQEQQKAIMQVQTAIANAKRAEQDAITAQKNGEAGAAKAKWDQEVIKATEVTKAEQNKAVAGLDVQTAELRKREAILQGEGEAEKRRLIMQADGALEKKLAAVVEINKYYADAVKGYQGNWVPSVIMGNGGNTAPGSGAQQLVDMLTAKTARELGIDLSVVGSANTVAARQTLPAKK